MRSIASDTVLIEKGKILLIKRGNEPFKDMWALPGGRLENNETTEECAIREMKEETGLQVKIIKLIGVYSDPKRDPRGIVSVAYLVKRKGTEMLIEAMRRIVTLNDRVRLKIVGDRRDYNSAFGFWMQSVETGTG
jgi:ADP-ribose pyrophosphatase YjhB (NUDIX family)